MQKITPFLWFNNNAEEAMNFYVSIFKNSKIESINRYEGGPMKDQVLTGVFELEGQRFMALDGGPEFEFTEAMSLYVDCKDQAEVDELWSKLTADGGEESMCGWLKDKYGVSWQIIPKQVPELLSDPDPERAKRAMDAMLQMHKIDVAAMQRAADGR